jgi:outer membrane receptor protein involved in Fe transport
VITYMVSPRLHLGDDTMIYVRVASGYRPGGPNVALPGIPTQVGADKLTNYEAGVKTELLDRRALINLSAFYIDWTDIQITIANDQNVSYGANGGEATSKGFELTTSFAVTEAFRLGANVAYTDATLSQDVPALGGKEGDRLPLSPRWNAALTADYDAPLTGDWRLSLGGGLRHRGSVYSALEGDPRAVRLKPYEVIDLYAAVTDGLLTGRIFVKNAGGREAYSTVYGTNRQLDLVTIQPRTIGVALDVKF